MRKEIFYAIFAGGILGLVLAFGIWRTNQALRPSSSINGATESPAPGSSAVPISNSGLTIVSPQNEDVMTQNPVRVSGITRAESYVTVSSEEQDYILQSEKDGSFQADIELSGGLNQVVVTSVDPDGTTHSENLTLVYSTEFK